MILVEKHMHIILRKNFEVFNAFTNFKALVEKESDCAIMVVRFDRRDE